MQKIFFVHAEWDQEAEVRVAAFNDVPGLVTEAETLTAKERDAFEELWGQTFEKSQAPELVAYMENLRQKGGSAGYDETGNYVRGLPRGKTEIIRHAMYRIADDLELTLWRASP